MQVTKENLKQEIDQFNDEQLKQIAEFVEFIKFRSRFSQKVVDLPQFASLYQEFAQEDRELAEIGMADYVEQLRQEEQL
jgi:succinyl-CoA synthetase beta subunit